MSACKGCSAPIVWVVTTGGKRMPVDAKAVRIFASPSGSLRVVLTSGEVISARAAEPDEKGAIEARTSHFATCPEAASFRRGRS